MLVRSPGVFSVVLCTVVLVVLRVQLLPVVVLMLGQHQCSWSEALEKRLVSNCSGVNVGFLRAKLNLGQQLLSAVVVVAMLFG